jgi:hypothetical protein
MNLRSIASRLAVLGLAAALVSSCGGTSGSVRPEDPPGEGPLKISYFRTNPEPKTKRPEPTYKVVMSYSWQQVLGETPRDPLSKAAPGKVFKGSAADVVIARYISRLKGAGLDQLESHNADDANPVAIYQQAISPVERDHPRIITVGTDKSARSYSFKDQQTEEKSRAFIACEKLVSAIMDGHVVLVTIDKSGSDTPSPGKTTPDK